jgi:hypothetical protein
MNPDKTITGRKTLMMEIPELLIAVNSKFSPSFPKVIKEEISIESGIAKGKVIKEK